jgi:very-short-patch-repair endonuclease
MVKQGILKAREKLIDLSLRNGMLNFKHSETSTRHVRLIDEKLEFLAETLTNGRSLEIASLPPVDTVPRDEDTSDFRFALKAAKTTDVEWLAAEDARRATGGRRFFKDRVAERALRDRVRASLGMPPWRPVNDPRSRAKDLGIDPSYDLPEPNASEKTRHTDSNLQTLFFPDRLEPKLTSIHTTARTLQEDAGISALYCALGFLEWFDTAVAENPAYAPLVLLPINMEKNIVNGEYVFSIAGRDEDETTNAALREKLKRHHSLDLPDYDPELGIDDYLDKVEHVIRNKKRWRIRRWATIGLFSFARQAMWSDLDPDNWPNELRPEKHELLQEIYGDLAADSSENIANLYDVDRPEMERKAPAIIIDADASQLSAVIDVADGKNVVIQGPPGTGKSQAITNIIANAMWQGKSVLFVSEKMAALKVVKDRLDDMKLGLYCLEIHSAKASKSQVFGALRERMQAPRPRLNIDDLESAKRSLQEARQRLTAYAALVNSPAGRTGLTVHDVLWGEFCRSTKPDYVPADALEFRFEYPLDMDRYKLAERVGAGKALDVLCESLGQAADPSRQIWRGIRNANLSRFDKPRALDAVKKWAAWLSRLEVLVGEIGNATGWRGISSIAEAKAFSAQLLKVPVPSVNTEEALLPLAREDAGSASLTRWAANALEAQELDTELEKVCSRSALEAKLSDLDGLRAKAVKFAVAEHPIRTLPTFCNQTQEALRSGAAHESLLDKIFAVTQGTAPSEWTARTEAMLIGFVRLSKSLPERLLRYRSAALIEGSAADDLEVARQIAGRANAALARAKLETDAVVPASPTQLRKAAVVFTSTGIVGRLFSSEWRNAKTLWCSLFPMEKKVASDIASRRLIAVAEWKEANSALEASFVVREMAGRHWSGSLTPFDALISVAQWMKAVRDIAPIAEPGANYIRKLLFDGSADELAPVWELADVAAAAKTAEAVAECVARQSTVHATAFTLREKAAALVSLIREANAFGPQGDTTIQQLHKAKSLVARFRECQDFMSREPIASVAAKQIRSGSDADRAVRVLATVKFAKEVAVADLPPEATRSLLHDHCRARLEEWRHLSRDTETALDAELTSRRVADDILQIDQNDWCAAPFEEADLGILSTKVQCAALAPDDLDKQLQLLSAEEEAASVGMRSLLETWVTAGRRYRGVAWAAEIAFYRSSAEVLMRDNPVLARHNGRNHEEVRKRFGDLDKNILVLNRRMVAAKLHERPIPPGQRAQSVKDYTDNQMLDHQTGLQKPRIALRRLFTNAGDAIRAYKPCVMMSPMSVAQYLEPGKHSFDLLVVDEASQMRPEDSLGAMLRCSQAVIVGDPEQLPPSDFFLANESGDDQEAEDAPEESILELGRRCWHPMRMLDVHYRSKHQSLISYSNREFYNERLLVYPSPILKDPEFGLTYHRVDGAYEPGQGRNVPEAKAVVEEALRLMRTRIDRSIGIVAVNQAQSDLIEKLLDEVAASDPDIQAYRQAWVGKLEAPFVKNLENVQGDERDIILVSTVYGRTAEGVFHQNFGPINKAYGHRRLNVLFTRAKRKLALFTSLDHTQITADGKQRGVRVLKEYLEYAATGTFQVGRQLGEEPDSDFERWFLERLKHAGYKAHPQVGVARYRVDIGVLHPDCAGNYIIGVECDGATYHSSKSARDRDRLRQDVLESLNWQIHRVWSTDWYRDPEREFGRLVQRIENLRSIKNQLP